MGGDEFESEVSFLHKQNRYASYLRVLNFINKVVKSDSNWFVTVSTNKTEYRLFLCDKLNITVLFGYIPFNIRSSGIYWRSEIWNIFMLDLRLPRR
jgi:hypothetical protein